MKKFFPLAITSILLVFTGCNHATHSSISDFSIQICLPKHAGTFEIVGSEKHESTIIKIRNPWQGAENVEQLLFVSRNGENAPDGFTGQIVQTPVRRVVCMSSSHVAMFDAIGMIRRIVGVSGIGFISNSHIAEHSQCGEVRDIGYDTNIDYELIAAVRPDIILLYGVYGQNDTLTGKLTELGLPYIYVGDYVEESPLGKAEWVKVAAELTDCRERGEALFDSICERYSAVKEIAAAVSRKPKVMLNTPYQDVWFMPSKQSYMVRLIGDAGGEYVYTQNGGNSSVPVNMEEAYLLARNADFWLNVGRTDNMAELKAQNPKFAQMPCVEGGRVYNSNRRQTPAGGSDFWESAIMRPDRVLLDLITILHPELVFDKTTYYYKQIE